MSPRRACVARQGPESLEVELNEARLRLEELEMRRSVRDASEDKYRLKMPAIKWEI